MLDVGVWYMREGQTRATGRSRLCERGMLYGGGEGGGWVSGLWYGGLEVVSRNDVCVCG